MKAVILANGIIEDYEHAKLFVSEADILICSDGGGKHALNMRVVPDLLIGDFDSIDQESLNYFKEKGTEIIGCSSQKDETDTQLAVEYAVSKGAREVVLLGCMGNRFDHTFANVSLLIWLLKRGINGAMINSTNKICVIDRYIRLQGDIGDKVSLLPITPEVTGIFTKGLQYILENGRLTFDTPRGISNVFTSTEAEIVIKSGILLVIKARE